MTFETWRASRREPAPRPCRPRTGPPQGEPVVVGGVVVGLHDRHLARTVFGGGGDGCPTPERMATVAALTWTNSKAGRDPAKE